MRKIFVPAIIGLVLTACAGGMNTMPGSDKWTAAYLKTHIVEGKTTQDEVTALYGVPDRTSESTGGGSSWRYKKTGTFESLKDLISAAPTSAARATAYNGVGAAQRASQGADSVTKVTDKVTGNAVTRGDSLSFDFDKNKRVKSWQLY